MQGLFLFNSCLNTMILIGLLYMKEELFDDPPKPELSEC